MHEKATPRPYKFSASEIYGRVIDSGGRNVCFMWEHEDTISDILPCLLENIQTFSIIERASFLVDQHLNQEDICIRHSRLQRFFHLNYLGGKCFFFFYKWSGGLRERYIESRVRSVGEWCVVHRC